MTERLIVIGGDAAGMSAASEAKRRRADLEILAFERGSYTSYSACGMPYYVGKVVEDVEQLVARSPEAFRERGIDARVRHEVEEIDLNQRRVRVRRLEDAAVLSEAFDHLIIATGAEYRRLTIENLARFEQDPGGTVAVSAGTSRSMPRASSTRRSSVPGESAMGSAAIARSRASMGPT